MTSNLTRRGFSLGAASFAMLGGASAALPGRRALDLAEERRESLVGLLTELVRIRSLSGESAADAQSVVKTYLGNLPYRVEESADRPSRYEDHAEFMPPNPAGDGPFVNIVGWPENRSARQFAMFSHIDTHSIDSGWSTTPLEPKVDGSRIYGLGTSDDKGGVAAMLVAASALHAAGEPLPVVMSLHGKGGGSRGSLPVFDRISQSHSGIAAVLYVHPAETGRGLADIKNAVLGVVDLELTVTGWRAPPMEIGSIDSADWADGGNAIDECWAVMEHLRNTAFRDVDVNIGIAEGGDRIGSVAETASLRFRLKFGGDDSWRALLSAGRDEINDIDGGRADDEYKYSISLEPVAYRTNPGESDWNAPVSRVLRDAIEDVTGAAPHSYPNHYAGDIRYPIRLLGVPAYGIGSLGGNFYGPNEWVDIDDLVRLVAVLIQTMSGWSDLPASRNR